MVRKFFIPLAVAGLLLAATAVALASAKPFKTGLYVGKTSQGEPLKLKVADCGKGQCVEALESAETTIELPCNNGEVSHETFFPSIDAIKPNGKVAVETDGFAKVTATLKVARNGSMTGTIHSTETLENGGKCNSGTVTLKAKIGGSTK
jgi:hypothetical protein